MVCPHQKHSQTHRTSYSIMLLESNVVVGVLLNWGGTRGARYSRDCIEHPCKGVYYCNLERRLTEPCVACTCGVCLHYPSPSLLSSYLCFTKTNFPYSEKLKYYLRLDPTTPIEYKANRYSHLILSTSLLPSLQSFCLSLLRTC